MRYCYTLVVNYSVLSRLLDGDTMILRRTYFCNKCKHIHITETQIGRAHAQFADTNELQLDKFGVIK